MLKIYFKYILIIGIILFTSACAFYLLAIPETSSSKIRFNYVIAKNTAVEKKQGGHSSEKVNEECPQLLKEDVSYHNAVAGKPRRGVVTGERTIGK